MAGSGVDQLVNYGALGVMVAVLLWFAHGQITRLVADRDRAEAQRDALTTKIVDEVGPALAESARAIRAREEYEDAIYTVLVDVRRLMEGQGR